MNYRINTNIAYLPTLPNFPAVSKFFIKPPGLPVRAPNLPGNIYGDLFQNFFFNFIIFEMSKRNIKQEMDLVLLFELFSIGKRKTWAIKLILSLVIGQKSTNQIAQYIVESWRGFCTLLWTSGTFGRPSDDFWRVFRHCRKWHSYTKQRFLDVSWFLYSGGWQVWYGVHYVN